MPEYLFEHEDGRQRTEYYHMAYAPRCGTEVELEGEIWTRIPALGSVLARREVHFTGIQQAPWDPAAPRHDKHGMPQFNSRAEIREYEAKTDWKYDEL